MGKDAIALKEFILDKVRLHSYLERDGFLKLGADVEQQIKCPFHGNDNKPSSRYYEHTNSMYCWVCQKSWDPVGYVMEKSSLNYGEALKQIVRENKLDISSVPEYTGVVRARAVQSTAKKVYKVDSRKMLLATIESELKRKKKIIPVANMRNIVYILPRIRKATDGDESILSAATKVVEFLKKL